MTNTPTTYHVWFATKRRKWLLQSDIDQTAKDLIREVASEKGISLRECETAIDHVHLLLRLHPHQTLSKAMNLIKGISSRKLHLAFPELKRDSHSHHLCQRGYNFTIVEPGSLTTRRPDRLRPLPRLRR